MNIYTYKYAYVFMYSYRDDPYVEAHRGTYTPAKVFRSDTVGGVEVYL